MPRTPSPIFLLNPNISPGPPPLYQGFRLLILSINIWHFSFSRPNMCFQPPIKKNTLLFPLCELFGPGSGKLDAMPVFLTPHQNCQMGSNPVPSHPWVFQSLVSFNLPVESLFLKRGMVLCLFGAMGPWSNFFFPFRLTNPGNGRFLSFLLLFGRSAE